MAVRTATRGQDQAVCRQLLGMQLAQQLLGGIGGPLPLVLLQPGNHPPGRLGPRLSCLGAEGKRAQQRLKARRGLMVQGAALAALGENHLACEADGQQVLAPPCAQGAEESVTQGSEAALEVPGDAGLDGLGQLGPRLEGAGPGRPAHQVPGIGTWSGQAQQALQHPVPGGVGIQVTGHQGRAAVGRQGLEQGVGHPALAADARIQLPRPHDVHDALPGIQLVHRVAGEAGPDVHGDAAIVQGGQHHRAAGFLRGAQVMALGVG